MPADVTPEAPGRLHDDGAVRARIAVAVGVEGLALPDIDPAGISPDLDAPSGEASYDSVSVEAEVGGARFCSQCGHRVAIGAAYCSRCGGPLVDRPLVDRRPGRENLVVAIAPVIALVGAGAVILGSCLAWVEVDAPLVGHFSKLGYEGDGVITIVAALLPRPPATTPRTATSLAGLSHKVTAKRDGRVSPPAW